MTFGIGHDLIREECRERFADCVDERPEDVPLAAIALDPVDVDGHRNPRRAQQRQDEGVRSVAEQHDVEVAPQCIQRGEQRVADGLEVLVAQRGKDDAVCLERGRPARPADETPAFQRGSKRYLMSARHQPRRQLRGECFEAAVARRDAARAGMAIFKRTIRPDARSETRLRLWMARRFAMIRARDSSTAMSAPEASCRSIVNAAAITIRSRISSNGALRSARYNPSFFSRSRKRFLTPCMLMTAGSARRAVRRHACGRDTRPPRGT